MKATFSESKKGFGERTRLICNQTHGVYVITSNPHGGFNIFCNGYKFAERSTMAWALLCLQHDAEMAVRDAVCS